MKKHPLSLAIALTFATSQPSLAQDTLALEEVIVTAQKREQRLLDVPMAITAVGGADITAMGIRNVQDLSFAIPGMSMREDGPGSYTIFMRGLANTDSNGALVGAYLDEAPLTLTGNDQLDLRPIDMARVEILKGPQGTLYGQGSIAGTIRFITNKPEFNNFSGSIKASLFSVDDGDTGKTVTAVVNVPVVENTFALRLAAIGERDGGWQDQPEAGIKDGNGQDLNQIRFSALWQASDSIDLHAMVQSYRSETQLGLGYEEPDRTVAVAIDPSIKLVPKEFNYDLYALTLNADLGFASFISATSYIDHDHQFPFTYFGSERTIYEGFLEGNDARYADVTGLTQEFRLVSNEATRLNWTLGLSYQESDYDFTSEYDTYYYGVVYPNDTYITKATNESYTLFGDLSYSINERLDIGVGVRYFEEDQTTFDGELHEADSFDSVDPRIYASYVLTDNTSLYVNVAKGFRSGGFNRGELPNYEPESVINYEIGSKGRVLNGSLTYEVAAYYTEYDDMLRRGLLLVGTTVQQLTSNIGTVEVKGVEGGVSWKPIDALKLSATASFIDSEVVSVDVTDATNNAGDPTDYVPELSYSLSAQYNFSWFNRIPGFARLDYNYRDAVSYVDRSSFPAENVPMYSDDLSLLNGRIGMDINAFTLELYGTNLTNENKYIDPYWAWKNANRTKPRTIGVEASYTF